MFAGVEWQLQLRLPNLFASSVLRTLMRQKKE